MDFEIELRMGNIKQTERLSNGEFSYWMMIVGREESLITFSGN